MSEFLENIKHVFFLGIGGIGMSGIAEILLDRGYRVSGSDRQLSDITGYLEAKGASVYQGHSAENLHDIDLLVYSSAISSDNPERRQAKQLKIPEIRRAEMLALLMHGYFKIAVAGTHGKTTTTALASHLAIQAGLDPTVVVGGRLKNLKTNARLGKGKIFITEADEYDRSFLTLSPDISVITTIEADHLDIYKDMEDIRKTFTSFANLGSRDGKIICCLDDMELRKLSAQFKKEVITYGFAEDAMYRAENPAYDQGGSHFTIIHEEQPVAEVNLRIPGRHNILNALAGFIIAGQLGIDKKTTLEALESFSGVDRRFEIKGQVGDITVVDDYAHHPTEVAATIESARSGWANRLIVVFQPHLFSRTKDFYKEFASALSKADLVILAEIYPAREKPIPGISSRIILNHAQKLNYKNLLLIPRTEDIEIYLSRNLKAGDMLITMGAGDIWRCGENVLKKLKAKQSENKEN